MEYIEEIYGIMYTTYMCLLCVSYYIYTTYIYLCMSYYNTCVYTPIYVSYYTTTIEDCIYPNSTEYSPAGIIKISEDVDT